MPEFNWIYTGLIIAAVIGTIMGYIAYLILLERWVAAWVQDRFGPNRLGVEMVLQHSQGSVIPFAGIGATTAVVFVGGYPEPVTAEALTGVVLPDLLYVQDLFASPLAKAAKYLLPGTSNFEKDGTFLNHAGYAQTFARAANPPKEVRSELQVASDLAGKRGLAQASAVRKDLAKTFPALAALAEPKAAAKGAARLELQTV